MPPSQVAWAQISATSECHSCSFRHPLRSSGVHPSICPERLLQWPLGVHPMKQDSGQVAGHPYKESYASWRCKKGVIVWVLWVLSGGVRLLRVCSGDGRSCTPVTRVYPMGLQAGACRAALASLGAELSYSSPWKLNTHLQNTRLKEAKPLVCPGCPHVLTQPCLLTL